MYQEVWKPHINIPNYEVSNLGRVRSIRRSGTKGGLLKPTYIKGPNEVITIYNLYNPETKKYGQHSERKLIKEHWKWEWIKYLEEGEEVREVNGYPDYFITNKGRVWNHRQQRFMKFKRKHDYYYRVSVGGKGHLIHQLVGRNFLPEYKEGLFILHRDETLPYPEVNYVENLWVGTPQDNSQDMVRKGRGRWDKITS